VVIAVVILVVNLPGRSSDPQANAGPFKNAPEAASNTSPGLPSSQVSPNPGTATGRGSRGAIQCGSVAASWQRSGDTVKVSVVVPPAGQVAAFVEAKGRFPVSKSVTDTGPHVFEFTGVPEPITRRIGVNVRTGQGMQTCYLVKR
jgi:hypothetical protein